MNDDVCRRIIMVDGTWDGLALTFYGICMYHNVHMYICTYILRMIHIICMYGGNTRGIIVDTTCTILY